LVARLPLLRGLVLVLLGVELQVEQTFQIARSAARAPAASTAALPSERYLDLAERGFGTQQILQRLLLRPERILPLLPLQLVRRRAHRLHRLRHVFGEALERFV